LKELGFFMALILKTSSVFIFNPNSYIEFVSMWQCVKT